MAIQRKIIFYLLVVVLEIPNFYRMQDDVLYEFKNNCTIRSYICKMSFLKEKREDEEKRQGKQEVVAQCG